MEFTKDTVEKYKVDTIPYKQYTVVEVLLYYNAPLIFTTDEDQLWYILDSNREHDIYAVFHLEQIPNLINDLKHDRITPYELFNMFDYIQVICFSETIETETSDVLYIPTDLLSDVIPDKEVKFTD